MTVAPPAVPLSPQSSRGGASLASLKDVQKKRYLNTRGLSIPALKGEALRPLNPNFVIRVINLLCGTQIKKNADRVKLKEYDDLYVVLLKENIEQGKELSAQEVRKMYKEGKIKIFKIILQRIQPIAPLNSRSAFLPKGFKIFLWGYLDPWRQYFTG